MIRGAREEGLTVGRLCSDTDKTSLLEEANEDGHIITVANTTATDHQEPHPHPNPPPEGEGILWGFFPTWGGFYGVFSLSWKVFQSLPFQGGGQEGDGVYMSL